MFDECKPFVKETSTRRVFAHSRGQPEAIGIVATQTVEAYYVYTPHLPTSRDVYLSKELQDFIQLNGLLNLGQWIRFSVQQTSPDRFAITSFELTTPLLKTLPSFNTILVECNINIPRDYDPVRYNRTVTSEFIPYVGDQDDLIHHCHHGKTLVATLRKTKTIIAGIYWSIEYIQL